MTYDEKLAAKIAESIEEDQAEWIAAGRPLHASAFEDGESCSVCGAFLNYPENEEAVLVRGGYRHVSCHVRFEQGCAEPPTVEYWEEESPF